MTTYLMTKTLILQYKMIRCPEHPKMTIIILLSMMILMTQCSFGNPVTQPFLSRSVRVPTTEVGCLSFTQMFQEYSHEYPSLSQADSLFTDRSTAHWLGSETLVSLKVEGHEVNALADSDSQVNTVMPSYMHQHEFPVLPLEDLMDYPLNLIELGGMRMRFLGFVILQVQVSEIAGYDEDIVFLVVPDESEFSRCVPLVIGTCMLEIVNVIRRVSWTDYQPPG